MHHFLILHLRSYYYCANQLAIIASWHNKCVLRNSQCAQKSQKKYHMKFASKAKSISLHKNYMKKLQLRLLISILAKVWAHEEKF